MTATQFDPWAELAVLENAECTGTPAKAAKPAKPALQVAAPAEWHDGVDRLSTLAAPAMVRPQRWSLLTRDARRFLRDWGAQAAALGWTTPDIFGAHPTHPLQRLDCAGLVWLLHGDDVMAITSASACMRTSRGATLTYYRRPRPGAVPLWQLG